MPYNYRDEIAQALETARKYRESIAKDPDLSDEGKRKALAKYVTPLEGRAQQEAASWLGGAQKRQQKAGQALLAAERAARESVDYRRQEYHYRRISDLAARAAWEDLEAELEAVLRVGDPYELAAWKDRAIQSQIDGRFPAGVGGRASDPSSGWWHYAARLGEVDLTPEPVKAAQEAKKAADLELQEAEGQLGTWDFGARRTGEPVLFEDIRNSAKGEQSPWVLSGEPTVKTVFTD